MLMLQLFEEGIALSFGSYTLLLFASGLHRINIFVTIVPEVHRTV